MSKPVVITTPRLVLRPYRLRDVQAVQAFRGDPDVARYQLWEPFNHLRTQMFIRKYRSVTFGSPGRWSGLAMQHSQSEQVIGDVALHISRDVRPQAQIGYNVARTHQRRGYASEAVRAMLNWLFSNTTVHRVTATCDSENLASAALLQKLGFRQEAHYRQNTWCKGKWSDEFVFALLKEEWTLG